MNKIVALVFFLLTFSVPQIFAQSDATQSVMRSEGKIYVVLAVCLTILIGLILYVVRIDKKITKIEKGS